MEIRLPEMPQSVQYDRMSVNLPSGKQRTDRVDGRLFLTDENLDRGTLALLAAARRIEVRMRATIRDANISLPQLAMLMELRHAPGLDVAGLRQRLGGTVPTIARLLGELDKSGLVRRPRSGQDGRKRALELSDTGEALVEKCLSEIRPDLTRVYRNAGEPSVTGALDLLAAIADFDTKEQSE